MAMKPAGDEATPKHLKYKTWVLKVSIDCEGCKKKVKKVLRGIEGVYATAIDAQLHMVTVTGDVDADTLIKRLNRSGKHAEVIRTEKPTKKEKINHENPAKDKKRNNPKATDDVDDDMQVTKKDDDGENPVETAAKVPETVAGDINKLLKTEKPGGGQSKKKEKKKKQSKPQAGDPGDGGSDREPKSEVTRAVGSPFPPPSQPSNVYPITPASAHYSTTPPMYGITSCSSAPYSGTIGSHYAAPVEVADPVVRLPPYDPIRFNGHDEEDYHYDYDDGIGCFIM